MMFKLNFRKARYKTYEPDYKTQQALFRFTIFFVMSRYFFMCMSNRTRIKIFLEPKINRKRFFKTFKAIF